MKTFRTLDLAIEFYALTEKVKLPNHLRGQLLRSSSSVSLNLAEGNAKFSYKDKKRIYQIAMGSLRESQVILKLGQINDPEILKKADHLGACIYKLLKMKDADETESSNRL